MTNNLAGFSEAELAAALRAKRAEKQSERQEYKGLVNDIVPVLIDKIARASMALKEVKTEVYKELRSIMECKYEVFGVKEEQQTHTFTDTTGQSVTIGYNIVDSWDDTVNSGIAKVNQYIQSLAAKNKDAETITIINRLLKRDPKGNLKASRVLELVSLSEEINNEVLTDGVNIIRAAYKPVRTSFFIKAHTVDKEGNKVDLPLNISACRFPDSFDLNFLLPSKDERN